MAVELLMKNATHRPSHDLESLFYVLVYICTNLGGPQTPRLIDELLEFKSLPLAAWFVPETSFEGLATSKLGVAHVFEKRIVDRFSPYFSDIKPCVMDLFHAMYPSGPQIKSSLTHDRMIEIFTATLEKLPPSDRYRKSTSEMHDTGRK
jgi:Fungal protein kinase